MKPFDDSTTQESRRERKHTDADTSFILYRCRTSLVLSCLSGSEVWWPVFLVADLETGRRGGFVGNDERTRCAREETTTRGKKMPPLSRTIVRIG